MRRVAELEALFDLQKTRMRAATERWRAEDPNARALTDPDLGDLLDWLMNETDRATGERDAAREALFALRARMYGRVTLADLRRIVDGGLAASGGDR